MSKEHEYIAGSIVALLTVILAVSNVLEISESVSVAMVGFLGTGVGWLFRGRINGMAK